jgi:hypothetical protein
MCAMISNFQFDIQFGVALWLKLFEGLQTMQNSTNKSFNRYLWQMCSWSIFKQFFRGSFFSFLFLKNFIFIHLKMLIDFIKFQHWTQFYVQFFYLAISTHSSIIINYFLFIVLSTLTILMRGETIKI